MPSLLLTAPPATEPLQLPEAKTYLRVEHDLDDSLIAGAITAVRQACEGATARALITQGWRLLLDGLPDAGQTDSRALVLPKAPLQSVTAVTMLAEDGTALPFSAASYYLNTAGEPGRLLLRDTASWPALLRRTAGLSVDYVAGYGDHATDVPQALRQGMLQHLAQLYTNRGDTDATAIPAAARALYQPYRLVNRP